MTTRVRRMLVLVACLLVPGIVQAQTTGRIQGSVTESGTARPLAGAQVTVEGTGLGMITNSQGRYLLTNVPAGTHTVRITLIGYGDATRQVPVRVGELTTANFEITSQAIALNEIVVTGTVGATRKAKLPIVVDQIRAVDMPVATNTASQMLQGKVAGAFVVSNTGKPGSPPSIMLRAPTSINASGRSQEPLFIVDGVILSSSMVDFDALDIESVEVVKGAAGASLYGSRAQAGVVQITTKRGSRMLDDVVRYTGRTEYGVNNITTTPDALFSTHHQYAIKDGKFVETGAAGKTCDLMDCTGVLALAGQKAKPGESANAWNTYMLNDFPGQIWDQVDRFFRPGVFRQQYISAEGRSGATNFHASFSNLNDSGIMRGKDGFNRYNFRLNLDQSVSPDVQVSATAFYSKNKQTGTGSGKLGSVFNLTRVPAGVNLFACEDDHTKNCLNDPANLFLLTDVFAREGTNPLHELMNVTDESSRGRFLGSANIRYRPIDWMSLDANVSYDRLDAFDESFTPKGYRTRTPENINGGGLDRSNSLTEGLNGSLTASFTRNLTGDISNRTQLRYLFETMDYTYTGTGGTRFAVANVPTLSNIDQTTTYASSSNSATRSDGYFAITNFDMYDKYVFDGLIRNDGSSLFGPDERRQWYYRLAGAWRLAEEDWFPVPGVDEFKLRYSYGTAGGRPSFSAQYETYSVSSGSVSPQTLGNKALKPEYTQEHEGGFDASFLNNRFGLNVTYAQAKTTDQIMNVPLPGYVGFGSQWRNAGTLESKTWELGFDTRFISRPGMSWTAKLLFDRTRQHITELNVPPYTYGFGYQGLEQIFYARPGEPLGQFYGTLLATKCGDLPTTSDCSQFAVNDDGLLVWVGAGGSLSNPQWGTKAPADAAVNGYVPMWGEPVKGECTDRVSGERTAYCPLGKSLPDYRISLSSNFQWKGFTVYGLVDSWQGMEIYNQPLQWTIFKGLGGIMDQTGKPENEQKPTGYYDRLYGTSGLATNSFFTEDASFVKLRELAVTYRLTPAMLGRLGPLNQLSGMAISLMGRNLATWTSYSGYDPEAGLGGSTTGSAAIARVEGYQYPPFRTWNLSFELNF